MTTIIEPQKKSFVAVEENVANENVAITYEIIDPTTKKSLYAQDFHTMSQFVLKQNEIGDKGVYLIVDEDNGTVKVSSSDSKKPWIFVGPYESNIESTSVLCYGAHYIFGSNQLANSKCGCKVDYNTFDTRKQL